MSLTYTFDHEQLNHLLAHIKDANRAVGRLVGVFAAAEHNGCSPTDEEINEPLKEIGLALFEIRHAIDHAETDGQLKESGATDG